MSSAASAQCESSDAINAGASKKDWTWQYCTLPDPHDKNKVKCNFCGHVSTAGINRFKKHLAGVKGNVRPCAKVPEEVQNRVVQSLENKAGKAKVLALRGTLRPRDEEDDHDMDEMRGSSSHGLKRQKGPVDKSLASPLEVAGVARQTSSRQTTSKDFNMQLPFKVCYSMIRWISEAVKLESFHAMCETRQQYDSEFRKPTVDELCELLLKKNVEVAGGEHNCSTSEKVGEEVERALARVGPAKTGGRSSPRRIEGPDERNLQLHFRSRLSLPLFTGGKVEGEQGVAIHVVLLDASTGHVITSGPESSAKLDVVVLEGDFNNEDDWTEEEFESHVVKEREGKRPLLTGDLQVTLIEGLGTLGEITFTDNSSWIRSMKFRLGLKIASGFCEEFRIREGKTEAFTVKDHRGELYEKHYPPALKDEVWRLVEIGKDGSFHKRLNEYGIYAVEDFLRLVVRDSQRLRDILGSGMSNKMWEVLVEHANTTVLSGKCYIYYSNETRNIGAIFNDICEFCGLIAGGHFYSAESLNDSQKVFADTLVKEAYDNWVHAIEYDGKALLNCKQSKRAAISQNEISSGPSNYPSLHNQQISQAPLEVPEPLLQRFEEMSIMVSALSTVMVTRSLMSKAHENV